MTAATALLIVAAMSLTCWMLAGMSSAEDLIVDAWWLMGIIGLALVALRLFGAACGWPL